jgi:hypothetical protein
MGLQRHGLKAGLPFVTVVFPLEGNAPFIERQQTTIGDRHSICFIGLSQLAKVASSASDWCSPKNFNSPA